MEKEYEIIVEKLKNKTLRIEDLGGILFERSINNPYLHEDVEEKIFELYDDNLTIENLKEELENNFTYIFEPEYYHYEDTYFRLYTKGQRYGTPGLKIDIIFEMIGDKKFERYLRNRFDFFNYEYEYKLEHSENMVDIYEELLIKAWHPNRFQHWCLSIDELKDINNEI